MSDRGDGPPEYNVYRSRRGRVGRIGGSGDFEALRSRLRRDRDPKGRGKRDITAGRVARWILLGIGGWLLLSLVLFLISAQIQGSVSEDAKGELSSGSFFGGSTVLVLGSDQRKGDSLDQSDAPGRADSIMLVHAQFGKIRKLSIPRDTAAEIPGHGVQKINAAYSLGGPALQIQTIENFLGNDVEINHLMEVDFKNFPELIDSMGGVDVNNKTKICADQFDNFWRGFNLSKGEHHLDGRQALGYARVRKNKCDLSEDDLDRAARQQEVMSAMRKQLVKPTAFFRLPWISWKAPQAIRTDMKGPGLMAFATDLATGGSGETQVLEPTGSDGSNLIVDQVTRQEAVDKLLGND